MSQYVVDEDGKKTHVLLTIEEYEELLEEIEDISDVSERIELNRKAIPHEEVLKILSE